MRHVGKAQNRKHKSQTKHKVSTPKRMPEETNRYRELEERTTEFAIRIVRLCKALPPDTVNRRLVDQIVRSSGSVGANYREANECLGKKDFVHRLRIARKECKETEHWMRIIAEANPGYSKRMHELFEECGEIRNILSAILNKAG
jgi:four helix bundle protein